VVHDSNSSDGRGGTRTFVADNRRVETLGLVMLLHVLVVGAVVSARALHAKLLLLTPPTVEARGADALSSSDPSALPSGRQLEEYVHAGLVELRIMLVQAARRRHD
jgi:hypothetical protein